MFLLVWIVFFYSLKLTKSESIVSFISCANLKYCMITIREANKVQYDFEKLSLEDWVTTLSFSSSKIKLIKCTNACHHIDVQLTVEIVGDDIPALLLTVVVPEAEVKPEIGAVPLPPVITGVAGVTHPTGVPHPPVETTIIYTANGPLNKSYMYHRKMWRRDKRERERGRERERESARQIDKKDSFVFWNGGIFLSPLVRLLHV